MPQLHIYVPEKVASVVRERARAKGMTVSGYLAELVVREVASDWPKGYFDDVVGGWEGRPLRRPTQGAVRKAREALEPGFLLDTNVCIRIPNGSSPSVAARLQATSPADVRLCSAVKAESSTAPATATGSTRTSGS